MKVKITVMLIQCNPRLHFSDKNYMKMLFDENNKFPNKFAIKNEQSTVKEICEKYLNLDYAWMPKQLANFRIYRNDNETIAEAVYIINIPHIIGVEKKGRMLSYEEAMNENIGVDSFYEQILTTSGRPMFR